MKACCRSSLPIKPSVKSIDYLLGVRHMLTSGYSRALPKCGETVCSTFFFMDPTSWIRNGETEPCMGSYGDCDEEE